jgi:multidrug efflux pump
MVLVMTSDIHTPGEMYDTASSVVQQKLSQLQGVGQVQVVGGSLPAVRVDSIRSNSPVTDSVRRM